MGYTPRNLKVRLCTAQNAHKKQMTPPRKPNAGAGKTFATLAAKYLSQLGSLAKTLSATNPYYVRLVFGWLIPPLLVLAPVPGRCIVFVASRAGPYRRCVKPNDIHFRPVDGYGAFNAWKTCEHARGYLHPGVQSCQSRAKQLTQPICLFLA